MDNWICKADSEVPVIYGDSFHMAGDTAGTNAIGHLKYVLNDVDDIRRSYFMLGFHLSEIKNSYFYHDFGYDNMKDFCINNVPVDYSILTRCIAVYERFCEHTESCFYTNCLNPKYEGFSFSQLVELLGLSYSSSDLPRLKNYPVAKLRDLKKFCLSRYGKNCYNSQFIEQYEASLNVVDNCDVATDEPEYDNCDVTTDDLEHDNCDVAIDEPKHDNCDVATVEPEFNNCIVTDDAEAEVLGRLKKLKGSVLYNFVRGFPTSRKLSVTLYDCNGRKFYGGAVEADILCISSGELHIRLPEVTITS